MKNSINKSGNSQTTIASVAALPANDDAEFVDCPGLQARFGIKRSLAYALLSEGDQRRKLAAARTDSRKKIIRCREREGLFTHPNANEINPPKDSPRLIGNESAGKDQTCS